MDRLLFGDNQFFGVNHASEEKARAQSMRFQKIEAIYDVLDSAYSEGIRTFMCTTHDRVGQVCDRVRANPERYPDFQFYPCMPYAHKYANAATELGIGGMFKKIAPEGGMLSTAIRGGLSLATKDIEGLAKIMIDSEMKMFKGVRTPVVFLQNVAVDFLVGIGMTRSLKIFADYIRSEYNAEPGFITMNLPKIVEVLEEVGVENPIVCSNINKVGFRMCGGIEEYERVLKTKKFRAVAMSVLASGSIPAEEAIDWVCAQPNIESIVFGASSRSNIHKTRDLVASKWDLTPTA